LAFFSLGITQTWVVSLFYPGTHRTGSWEGPRESVILGKNKTPTPADSHKETPE